jgi:hypothetical protein
MSITTESPVQIHADHITVRHLGNWTTASRMHVRARGGSVLLDLRSPELPDEVEVHVEADRAAVKLLVPEDATVDQWDLQWTGRGKVEDWQAAGTADGRRIRLTGTAARSEIRVNRGGVATLFALLTREGLADARRAHQAGAPADPQV